MLTAQTLRLEDSNHRIEASNSDLSGSTFSNVNLSGASLDDVNLSGMSLSNANLSGACFEDIRLTGMSISNANLTGLIIRDANLSGVSIADCNITGMTIDGILVADLFAAYNRADKFHAIFCFAAVRASFFLRFNSRSLNIVPRHFFPPQ